MMLSDLDTEAVHHVHHACMRFTLILYKIIKRTGSVNFSEIIFIEQVYRYLCFKIYVMQILMWISSSLLS